MGKYITGYLVTFVRLLQRKAAQFLLGGFIYPPIVRGSLGEQHQLEIIKGAFLPSSGELDVLGPFDNLLEHFILSLRGGQGGVHLKQLFDFWDDVFPAGGAGLVHNGGVQAVHKNLLLWRRGIAFHPNGIVDDTLFRLADIPTDFPNVDRVLENGLYRGATPTGRTARRRNASE